MTDEKKKPQRRSSAPKAKKNKNLDISLQAVIDNIAFSKKDVYAYFKIKSRPYDFVSSSQKIQTALDIGKAFSSIALNSEEETEVALTITHVPIDIDAWKIQIEEQTKDWQKSQNFENYLENQVSYLENENYNKKVAYLAVKIANRGAIDLPNIAQGGLVEAKNYIFNRIDRALFSSGATMVSAEEEASMRKREQDYFRILSSNTFEAERATSEEILLLLKRQFYPAMPTPYLLVDPESRVGPGDIVRETGSHVEKKWNYLKITQMIEEIELEGYRASMVFAGFPKESTYPYSALPPFLYYSSMLGAPYTSYGRFTLIPASKMKKVVETKKKQQKDEMENYAAGRDNLDSVYGQLPADTFQAVDDAQMITEILISDSSPWVEGVFRVAVEAEDLESLNKRCTFLKESYNRFGVTLIRTGADQVDAFLEQMPADRIRTTSFTTHANLPLVATSGFNFDSEVGDPIYGG